MQSICVTLTGQVKSNCICAGAVTNTTDDVDDDVCDDAARRTLALTTGVVKLPNVHVRSRSTSASCRLPW